MTIRSLCAVLLLVLCVSSLPAQAAEPRVQWRPDITVAELQTAHVVRITPQFHAADMAKLRDDQVIETTSGHRMPVRQMRAIFNAVAQSKARPLAAAPFKLLPPATAPCTPRKPGESEAQLLARPATDVICTASGKGVSVAQLRLMAPYADRQAVPAGREIVIADKADLHLKARTVLRTAPDSTVLVSPKGTRVTLGALRSFLRSKHQPASIERRAP